MNFQQPTTYWITSPQTTLIGNVAAGSDMKVGTGFWYLFPDAPVGLSKNENFMKRLEAKRTPITKFENNLAHSNGQIGLAVFNRLRDDHGITGCSTYDPRDNPHVKPHRSNPKPAIFDGFTGKGDLGQVNSNQAKDKIWS